LNLFYRQETLDGRGFTLLEILVAVAILGMAYLVVLQNFSMSLRNIDRIDRKGRDYFTIELEMEKYFMSAADEYEADEVEGFIYAQGDRDQVLLVISQEDERLQTLVIKEY